MQKGINYRLLFLILVCCPFILSITFHFPDFVDAWVAYPKLAQDKVQYLLSDGLLANALEMRQTNMYGSGVIFYLSKLLYGKPILYISEFISWLSYFSPRFYFQAGDASLFSTRFVEPIVFLLSPIWVFGFFTSIKLRKFKVIVLYVAFTLLAYMSGKREFAYLLPAIMFMIYFIYLGSTRLLPTRWFRRYLAVSVVYGVYILLRLAYAINI